jgi:hypothetical protein
VGQITEVVCCSYTETRTVNIAMVSISHHGQSLRSAGGALIVLVVVEGEGRAGDRGARSRAAVVAVATKVDKGRRRV